LTIFLTIIPAPGFGGITNVDAAAQNLHYRHFSGDLMMRMSTVEVPEALGVDPADIAAGATWLLSLESGSAVTAKIERDRDDGSFTATVTESRPDDESEAIAWITGQAVDGGFEIVGRDCTGETSNADDPRGAAAAFRRQLQAIRSSLGGRKVA
jgi:hypothetical protein